MSSLAQYLSGIVGEVFAAQGLSADLGAVRVSDRPDLCQFQCNGAMAAAKVAKKNPREIAQGIAEALSGIDALEKVEIAGPGFINLDVKKSFISSFLAENSRKEKLGITESGAGQVAVLDYGGPNIAKPMHVGHLRASIIGDSLRRVMLYAGFQALGDVHMGDWGTHLGMLLSSYMRDGKDEWVRMLDLEDAAQVQALFTDMAERYPKASAACKEDEALKAEAQEVTVKLQGKEEPYYAMWQVIRDVSVLGMKKNFDALNVHFDLWKGEADVHDYIAPMVEGYKAKGLAVESDGALVVNVAEDSDSKDIPPLILYKRDGGVMYGTTDLATLVEREKLYDPDRVVYIVDQRQGLHFEQVFRAARKGGIVDDSTELTHAGFGTMNGPDGKPFKTRAGGVMRLDDLIQMGVDKARQRLSEADIASDFGEEEYNDIAHKVAIAALKFADLQNNRVADYVFDLDRMTSFEGKTGPYLLYQAVRIKSLLRKAEAQGLSGGDLVIGEDDQGLALLLCELPDHFEGALHHYAPHILCEYVFRLAQAFSSFYGQCHILSEEDDAVRASRLTLCELTYSVIELCLNLLGVRIPERM